MKRRQLGMIAVFAACCLPVFAQIQHITYPGQTSGNQALRRHLQQKPLSQELLRNMAGKPLLVEPVLQAYDHAGLTRKSADKLPVTYFKPAPASILPRQLAEAETSPKAKANAIEYYEGLIRLYNEVAVKDDFPANSVAYAFNYYVVNNYHVAHDLLSNKVRVASITPIGGMPAKGQTVTLSQERNLFCQFEQLLGEDPSIRQMTDQEKQSITESLAIMTNECFKLYQYALENDDKEVRRRAQDTAMQNLIQLLGDRAGRMRITDRGMEF